MKPFNNIDNEDDEFKSMDDYIEEEMAAHKALEACYEYWTLYGYHRKVH